MMKRKGGYDFRTILILAALVLVLSAAGSFLWRETSKAFGGNFGPMAQQQMGRFQISGRDANSAWVIDTAVGDIYLIYQDGKWKEIGGFLDEKKRIKK